MRTHDISGAVGPGPNSGAMPMQNAGMAQPVHQPMSGPMPVAGPVGGPVAGPPSGPQPSQYPPSGPQPVGPMSGPNPQVVGGPPAQFPPATPGTANSKKPWLIVGAVAVVVLALVGVLLVVNSNSDDGGGTAGGGGGGTTSTKGGGGGGGGGGETDCTSTEVDDKGFTPCMATFAGRYASDPSCKKGMYFNGQDMTSTIEAAGAQPVTCDLPDKHSLIYMQFPNETTAQQMVTGFKKGAGQENLQPVDWSGGGYTGQYWSIDYAGVGALLYTVKDKPLAGFVMNLDSTNTSDTTSLPDYFDQNVKPG